MLKNKKASSAGFEPARASPMDFKSISLTTRTQRLTDYKEYKLILFA